MKEKARKGNGSHEKDVGKEKIHKRANRTEKKKENDDSGKNRERRQRRKKKGKQRRHEDGVMMTQGKHHKGIKTSGGMKIHCDGGSLACDVRNVGAARLVI